MSLLLDTHVLLWWLFDDPRLCTHTAQVIDNSGADVVVSSVSGFEIATKKTLGKLEAPDDLVAQLDEGGFTVLPLSLRHGLVAGALPMHHRDPFDRLLIAQAQCEGLTLVTADPALRQYDVGVLPA